MKTKIFILLTALLLPFVAPVIGSAIAATRENPPVENPDCCIGLRGCGRRDCNG